MKEQDEKKSSARLTAIDWVNAAFRALVQGGISAVRIEPIARSIKTTKGSFYWHYKDLAALKEDMLQRWVKLATDDITAAVVSQKLKPREALLALIDQVSVLPDDIYGGAAVEPAIRDWGRFDEKARQVVAEVDVTRMAYLQVLFIGAGLNQPEASNAAKTFYAIVVGVEHLRLTSEVDMAKMLRELVETYLG